MQILLLFAIFYTVASTLPVPLVVPIGSEDFSVAYDYSTVHMLSFGIPTKTLETFAKYYYLDVIFVDVPVDHNYLRDKFHVENVPHACVINANQTRLNETIFHLKPPYTSDSLWSGLLKYKPRIEQINVLPGPIQYEW